MKIQSTLMGNHKQFIRERTKQQRALWNTKVTGDWAGDEGRIAMLHKKELVLNSEQTEHILSSAKLMDSVMRMMPKFNAKQSTPQFATAGGQNITIQNMELKFDKFKGTREDANNMVATFITKLKKM